MCLIHLRLQCLAIDLASIILWQFISELDRTWILVGRELCFYKVLQLAFQFHGGLDSNRRDDESLRLDQTLVVACSHYGALEHCLVFEQAILNLCGRDVYTAHFQHLIRAATVPIVTSLVDAELISTGAPIARERCLRFLVCVPVTQSR